MKLYVPACGDRIVLSAPWEFPLYLEHRNVRFAQARGLLSEKVGRYESFWDGERYSGRFRRVQVTLEAGTVIECDRVYIRSFNKSHVKVEEDFDSITWKVMRGDRPAKNQRFWVKLSDCNGLECEVESLYRDRVKLVREVMES